MKRFKEFEEAYGRRHDAYTRDYHSSISGMGKHQSAAYHADGGANDEGWGHDNSQRHERQPDHPHSVHINGKKWKTFGSHSHATNVARKIKGATVHREEVQIDELSDTTLMNYAQKVHDDSQKHDKDPSKRSATKRNKSVMGFSRALNKLESRPHKEETETCQSCGKNPCWCDDSHGFVQEEQIHELSSGLLQRYKDKARAHADKLSAEGQHAKANKRLLAHMKATGKQIEKTTANIKKALQ